MSIKNNPSDLCVFLRYHSVQSSLTQQKSGLQDAQTLTEFLECEELEESQELCRQQCVVQVGSQKWHLKGHFPHFVSSVVEGDHLVCEHF